MTPRTRAAVAATVVAAAVAAQALVAAPAHAAAPAVTQLSDTQLDPSAIYFVSYDGLVNNAPTSRAGSLPSPATSTPPGTPSTRYAMSPAASSRRGAWQTLQLPHSSRANDSHNSISLGVSQADGRLHVAMDTHSSTVCYVKSEAGLVTNPGSRSWVASRFGAVQRTPGRGRGHRHVHLPAVPRHAGEPAAAELPHRRLRQRHAGVGRVQRTSWTQARQVDIGHRAHTASNGATSTTRNTYLHGITYGPGGRLHAAFTWREGNSAVLCNGGGLANHDTDYAYSDDRGRTWRNGAGTLVATTGSGTLVSVGSPGLMVDPLSVDHGLINQESQAVDAAGRLHVIISYVPGRFTQCVSNYVAQRTQYARPFHVWQDTSGAWHKMEIPVALGATGRSQLVLDNADNAYVVLPFGRVVTASKASGWTDWTVRYDGSGLNAFGEVVVDRSRVRQEGVLSILYQREVDRDHAVADPGAGPAPRLSHHVHRAAEVRIPGAPWPLLLAAVRDEFTERAWDPPARHWDGPAARLIGGRDRTAGGTWLAVDPDGPAVAAILNGVRLPLPPVPPAPAAARSRCAYSWGS